MSKRSRNTYEAGAEASHAPYAIYGTPLPAYDPEARDDGSYVPLWKQEVTDERGRKRLHGAFTGGFSAGYFNTVGSKEGWTPSTFVSSRANRAKDQSAAKQQRPEDFMDDEDLAEQAESQKLETVGGFAGLGSTGQSGGERGIFSDLFRNPGESMGVKLLQKMGWRQGQGIGPMIRRKARGDAKGDSHLFAPEDTQLVIPRRKTDRNGLGFAGQEKLEPAADGEGEDDMEDRDARILQTRGSKLVKKPKKSKKGGFGVGVLNDNGSDEEDPYAIGPQINYSRTIVGAKKKKDGPIVGSSDRREVVPSQKLLGQRHSTANTRKCHDGQPPLEGFILSLSSLSIQAAGPYASPKIPDGWTSSKQEIVSDSPGKPYQSSADAAKESNLDEKARAALLGEQQLPGKSVFDFMTPATRDRLVHASGKTDLPQARGEGAPSGFEMSEAAQQRTLWDQVPHLDKEIAESALQRGRSGWMPYAEDEAKRQRYRYFLELKADQQSFLPDKPTDFSLDDWSKELREFAQAATVFKPVSGLMAARFTSSSSSARLASDAPDPHDFPPKDMDPREKAAELNMYGPLTRTTRSFNPTRLICKRFGVPPPVVDPDASARADAEVVPESKRISIVSQASIESMLRESKLNTTASTGQAEAPYRRAETTQPVNSEKNEALEGERPGEAVFHAIFGSDSEGD